MFGGKKKDEEKKGDEEEKKQDAAPAASAAEEKSGVQTMKRGDYMIHVLVEQAKNMKVDEGATVDPIVEINCLGERKFTQAQDDIDGGGIASWNEHIFFEPKNCEKERLEKGKIEIKLLDKGFFKDALIGYYEFDLSYIYLRKDHALMHKWIIMSNPESDDFGEVTGYLKISITVCGEGDEQVSIEDDPNPDEDDVLQPPQIQPEFYQLKIRFFQAQKIVPMDTALFGGKGNIDAYIRLDHKGTKVKSKVLEQVEGGSIDWNQEFLVPAQVPLMGGRLVFKVFDEDNVCDEVVGSITIQMKNYIGFEAVNVADEDGRIIPQFNNDNDDLSGLNKDEIIAAKTSKNGRFFWKNIYGAPLDTSGKTASSMNENPEIGSLWKGRILMQVIAEKTDKPVRRIQDIPQEDVEMAKNFLTPRKYQFNMQIDQAIAIPEEGEKYEVVVRIAEHEFSTGSPVVNQDYFNRYNKRIDGEMEMPYVNLDDIGSVFVYLQRKFTLGGTKKICYFRAPVTEFKNLDPANIRWVELQPDLAIGEITETHKAGLVGMRLSIHDATAKGPMDWKSQPFWKSKVPRRPMAIKVRAYIFQCRDLPAADSDGASDPFLKFIDSGKAKKTRVIFDNLNPIFYEAIDLEFEANKEDELPPFIIDCYDLDQATIGADSYDFLARAVVKKEDCRFTLSEAIAEPKWHPMRYNSKSPPCGELLCSFSIVEPDLIMKKPQEVDLAAQVKMREFQVSLNVLGMRGLQSPGILPVKKAFVKFNLKGLVPPSVGTDLQNLKTDPKAPGPNPTICTLMMFQVPLPVDPLYCPRLSCQVYDCIFTGFSQPIIGQFVIPVGELMHDLKRERDEEIAALRQMVIQLDKIADGEEVASLMYQSQRQELEQQLLSQGASEEELAKVRDTPEQRKKMYEQFAEVRRSGKLNDVSVNLAMSLDDAKGNLLTGDSNEELRMQDRLEEKKENAREGKMKRITVEDIRSSQRSPNQNSTPDNQLIVEEADEKDLEKQQDEAKPKPGSMLLDPKAINTGSTVRKGSVNKSKLGASPSFQKFDANLKKQLMNDEKERVDKAKRDAEDERQRELEEFRRTGLSTTSNIVLPKYYRDETLEVDKEKDKPPESAFIGLGWDEDRTTERRHYRRFFPDELENIKDVLPIQSPFQSYDIKRGQTRGAKASLWASLTGAVKQDQSGQTSSEQIMGKFKAVIEVEVKEEKEQYMKEKEDLFNEMQDSLKRLATVREMKDFELDLDKLETIEGREELEEEMEPFGIRHLKITKILADIQSDVILQRMLLQQNNCIVRVYMVSAYDLASRDIGGFSDPYLKLAVGDETYNERDNYILDDPKPDFLKHYDFPATFPGCPPLQIDCMDYDDLFGDDLIGSTSVDLEDRYFLAEWRAIKDKPVEFRQIYHPSSAVSQGVLKMWVEILPARCSPEDEEPIWNITKKPPQEFEVRLVVWDTKEIKMMDAEGTSDVFIKAFFDNKDALETDCHYRCQDGKASFNYRLLFKQTLPRKDYRLTLQAFDRDFFKSNDIIGSAIIDLKQAMEDAEITKRLLAVNKKYFEQYMKSDSVNYEFKDDQSFWVPMSGKNENGQKVINGYVRIQVEIVPIDFAEKNKVGAAREEPNTNPFLPPPVGRLSFSLNPLKMFNQLVGPAMRRKIYCWCCIGLCIFLCVMLSIFVIPNVIGTIIAGWFTN